MKITLPLIVGSAVVLLTSSPLRAQDTWNSGTATVWNVAGNWSSGSVPASTDTVTLDNSNVAMPTTITLTSKAAGSVSAGVLNIGSGNGPALTGMTVQASGTLTTTNTLTLTTGSLTMDGSLLGGVNVGGTASSTGTLVLATSASGGFSITNNSSTQALTLGAIIGVASDGEKLALNSSGGAIVLANANASTGAVTVGSGSNNTLVQTTNASALSSFTGVTVANGSAVDLDGVGLTATNFTINGAGFGAGIDNGALVNSTGSASDAGTIALASNATIKNSGTGLTLSGPVNIGTNTLTVDGTGTTTISGVIGGTTGGLAKIGTGTLQLTGAAVNTYTGTTTVNGGTLIDNLSNLSAATNLINSGSSLVLGGNTGGTLQVNGKASTTSLQTFNGTTINAGANSVVGSGTVTIALGAITRNAGGTVNFTLPSSTGSITTSTANTNGILGAWATVGNTAYATAAGTGSITSYAGGTAATAGGVNNAAVNYTLGTALTLSGASTGNTLQYTGGTATLANGGNNLTLNGLMNSGTGVLTVNGAGNVIAGTLGDLVITGNSGITIASAITSGNLVDSNTGTVTLSGANTYSGATYINSGVLNLNSSLSNTTAITVGNGVTFNEGAAVSISGTLPLTIGNGSTVTLAGANSYTGTTTLGNASTLNINNASAIGSGTLVINGGTINNSTGTAIASQTNNPKEVWNNSFTFTGGSSLNLGTGAVALNLTPTITASSNTLTVGGVISGNWGLTKAGSGVLVLNGNNTYTGLTTVSAGTLTLNGNNTGGGGIKLSSGLLNIGNLGATGLGTLDLGSASFDNTTGSSGTLTNNNNIDLAGATTFVGSNSLDVGTGTIAVISTSTLTVSSNTLTFDGTFDPSGAFSLTKAGAGTLLFTGVSSTSLAAYTGGTTVSSGTLEITGALNTGTGAVTINNGATLDLSGAAGKITLTTTGTVTVNNGGTLLLDNRNGNEGGGTGGQQLSSGAQLVLTNGSHLIDQGATTGDTTTQSNTTLTLGSGISTITVDNNNSGSGATVLNFTGLSSGGAGEALINGVNLGVGSSSSSAAPFVTSSTPGTVGTTAGTSAINSASLNTKIVPYLLGESGTTTGANGTATGTANTFLTYVSGNGYRPLNPLQEFANNTITSGDNTYITSATSATGSVSINSLVINGGNLTESGTGTLTNASGALLFVTSNTLTGGTYNLGTTLGYVTTDANVNAVIGSTIIGTTSSTGLNVFGYSGSSLDLTGSNSYTGTTSVENGATLMIGNNNALGAAATILFNGGSSTSNGGTVEADNQARTISNIYYANGQSTYVGGSNDLTFAGNTNTISTYNPNGINIAFSIGGGGNSGRTAYVLNTGVTTVSGGLTVNDSAESITIGSSADLVITGAILDQASGVPVSGLTIGLTSSGNGGNITIDPTAVGGNTFLSNLTENGDFYNTLTFGGVTPTGSATMNPNTTNVFFYQALTNNYTLGLGLGSGGGSGTGLNFAGVNNLTMSGAINFNASTDATPSIINIATGNVTFTGTLSQGFAANGGLNFVGTGNTILGSGSLLAVGTGTNSLEKTGSGQLTISGGNNLTGTNILNGGTVELDYSTNNTNKLAQSATTSAAALSLNGVNLQLNGGSFTQALGSGNGTTLAGGQSSISQTGGGSSTIALGALTRSEGGGVINFASGVATTSSTVTNGILGAYATVGGTDWAFSGTSGTNAITALPSGSYTALTNASLGTSTGNYLFSGSSALSTSATAESINSLKMSATANLTLGNALTLTSGGLLFTGASNVTISSGTLTAASGTDLIIQNYGAGTLTISSTITAPGGTADLIIAGTGTTVLGGSNTIAGDILDGGVVQISADNNLGSASGSVTINGGTLVDTNTGSFTSTRSIVVGTNGGTIGVATNGTLTLSGVVSGNGGNAGAGALTFGKSGYAGLVVLTGSNTIGGAININAGTVQYGTGDATALGKDAVANNRSLSPVTVNGGTLDINGNTANVGNLTLVSGTIADSAGGGALSGYTLVLESGTVGAVLTNSGATSTTSLGTALDKVTSGTVILTGNNTYSGATLISGGTLQIGNGGTTGSLGTANVNTSESAPVDSGFTASAGTIAFDRSDVYTVNNAISGTGGVTQMGTGTLILSSSNSYSGTTAINNGTLQVSAVAPLSAATVQQLGDTSGITLGVAGTSSGVLRYTGGTGTLGASITAQGNGGDTVLNAGTGTLTLSGGLVKNGTTLTLNAGTGINVASAITGTAANSDMDFTNGKTTISTAATYNGPTWIYGGGNVVAAVANALPTSTSLNLGTAGANGVATGTTTTAATFDIDGNNQTVGGLNTEGTGSYTSDIVTNGGAGTSTSTLTVTGGGTFAGVIQDGTTAKTAFAASGGVMTLSASNTYSGGTSVTAGTLLVSNTGGSATGSGALAVGPGATIGGYGTSSSTSFSLSGTGTTTANVLVGMNSASDTNTSHTLTLLGSGASTIANANLTFNLNATTNAGSNSGTQLVVGGTNITFGSAVKFTLNMQDEPAIVAAYTPYVLIAGTGTTTDTMGVSGGQYSGLTLGAVTTLAGGGTDTIITGSNLQLAFGSQIDTTYYGANSYLVLYQNTGVDDIEVEVVPEPGTWAMMLGGLAMLVFWQRRRQKKL